MGGVDSQQKKNQAGLIDKHNSHHRVSNGQGRRNHGELNGFELENHLPHSLLYPQVHHSILLLQHPF